LTEHHTAGGMSRFVPYLSELQPAMFVEVDPELAAKEGLENGGWATIYSSRSAIEARVIVTDRIKPIVVQGRKTHQIGLPYHWGTRGLTTGGAANDLTSIALDPNVHIQEVKAFTVGIKSGRRPRGAALPEFVDEIRSRAHQAREGSERVEPEAERKTTRDAL
jgi:formate dehydrogenase major subunit